MEEKEQEWDPEKQRKRDIREDTPGGQGLGKADNWRAKTENKQKRRTTSGQGPEKADNHTSFLLV